MKVYIVRHGQIPSNALKKYSNPYEDLNDLGVQQAEQLKEIIKNINFDVIYVSPYLRAKHTAEIINVNHINTIIDDRLSERNCGDLSGKPFEVTDGEEYWNYNTNLQYGTSENIRVFFERITNFLDELKSKDYKSVLVVAHTGVSKGFSAYFEGIKDGKFLKRGLKNCEIKEYEL